MRKLLILAALLIPLMVCGQMSVFLTGQKTLPLASRTFFVDTNGNNSNSGYAATAAWKTVGFALTNSTSGSTVQLQGGQTFAESNLTILHSMTLASYGTGMATLNPTNSYYGIAVTNLSGVRITNIRINATNCNAGIFFCQTNNQFYSNNAVTGCEIYNSGTVPYWAFGTNSINHGSVTLGFACICDYCDPNGSDYGFNVVSNALHDSVHNAFQLASALLTNNVKRPTQHVSPMVAFNTISNFQATYFGTNFGTGECLSLRQMTNATCAFNRIHDTGLGGGPGGTNGNGNGIAFYYSVNCYGFSNEVFNVFSPNNIDGIGMDNDIFASGSTFWANYIHDCYGAAFLEDYSDGSNTNCFNVVAKCGYGVRYENCKGTNIAFNNTIFTRTNIVVGADNTPSGGPLGTNYLINNIFIGGNSAAGSPSDLVLCDSTNFGFINNSLFEPISAGFFGATMNYGNANQTRYLSLSTFNTAFGSGNIYSWQWLYSYSYLGPTNVIPFSGSPVLASGVTASAYNLSLPPTDAIGTNFGTVLNIGAINGTNSIYPPSLLTNCVAAVNFDEGIGTNVWDSVYNVLSGYTHNAPAWTNFIQGGGLILNSNLVQYAVLPAFSNTPPFTVSIWSRAFTFGSTLVFNGAVDLSVANWIFKPDFPGSFFWGYDGASIYSTSGTSPNTNSPVLWTMTASNSVLKVWSNSVVVATGTFNKTDVSAGQIPIYIGTTNANPSAAVLFNGDVYQYAQWGRVLNSNEISTLYNSGAGKKYPFN